MVIENNRAYLAGRQMALTALTVLAEAADSLPPEYQVAISDEVGELFMGTVFRNMAEFIKTTPVEGAR